MANVNLAALDMFRTAKDWTADSIANLDGRSIKNVGEYGGALSVLSRSSIEKSANNEMRTELLKSLANAFDMQVMTDNDGKARFTKEFLRNLERKIGAEFKRDDFKLDADGKAPDLPEDSVHQFMDVFLDFEGEKWCSKDAGWNKQLADAVKSELRGKKCVMQDFDAPHKLGEQCPRAGRRERPARCQGTYRRTHRRTWPEDTQGILPQLRPFAGRRKRNGIQGSS